MKYPLMTVAVQYDEKNERTVEWKIDGNEVFKSDYDTLSATHQMMQAVESMLLAIELEDS